MTSPETDTQLDYGCPVDSAMGLLGSRSAMLIMREAFYGTTRFDDFVRLVKMAPATASTHLRALTDAGLLVRRPYREPGGRTRDEYTLTGAGADLRPVVLGLFAWGRRHAGVQPQVEISHARLRPAARGSRPVRGGSRRESGRDSLALGRSRHREPV